MALGLQSQINRGELCNKEIMKIDKSRIYKYCITKGTLQTPKWWPYLVSVLGFFVVIGFVLLVFKSGMV
ncbi:MAG: hypothetical protein Ct9H90mP2_09150 [Dehalococcoidia bacterium]|nr:MAG: hypothetical protein Ct9H90mP2_09150 [Dehalococcoidia bacterium]